MSTTERIEAATRCFACGPDNPIGLQIRFSIDENNVCHGSFTANENHVGYQNTVHGGIIYAALDDVMANWLYLQGERALTARCELRFRAPAPSGEKLLLEGELVKRKGRHAILAGRAFLADSGKLVAEATATFMILRD